MMLVMLVMIQMLSVSAVVIANLCVSYIMTSQRDAVSSALYSLVSIAICHISSAVFRNL